MKSEVLLMKWNWQQVDEAVFGHKFCPLSSEGEKFAFAVVSLSQFFTALLWRYQTNSQGRTIL